MIIQQLMLIRSIALKLQSLIVSLEEITFHQTKNVQTLILIIVENNSEKVLKLSKSRLRVVSLDKIALQLLVNIIILLLMLTLKLV